MPALIPGYECDVFVSYRQKDNKGDHWVTEFVDSLRTELESIFKEDISIYFDCNPTDGLLETHDVQSSLEKRLKCLVFIPIISQTYCDPKAFAWQHEFLAFRKNASEDEFGLKVKLINRNIASRILPVSIHDLDADDKQLLEAELGGPIRGVEFIYRSTGVVRPLKHNEEDNKANLNHTFYRDQINKVARAIKELVTGMQTPRHLPEQAFAIRSEDLISLNSRRNLGWLAAAVVVLGIVSFAYYYFGGFGKKLADVTDKSIAVLPFTNMSNDPEQDYFSDGISEDILNHLTKIADLKVKSRTSTLQYKGTQKAITEIGDELAVGNVVEGSVRRVGDKIRVVVQLVDAKTDVRLWSESYDREVKDVLALQSEIAIQIADALEARLTATERKNIQKESSQNALAYDYFLRAREGRFWFNGSKAELQTILQMVDKALQLDPNFSQAYALKARAWYNLRTFGVKQTLWQDSALFYCAKAISIDPSSPEGYIVQGNVYRYLGRIAEAEDAESIAYRLAPNNADALRAYGMQLLRHGDERGADMILRGITKQYSIADPDYYVALSQPFFNLEEYDLQTRLIDKSISMGNKSFRPFLQQTTIYWFSGQYEKGLVSGKATEKLIPESNQIIDDLAWLYYLTGDYENAAKYWSRYKEIESRFEDSTQTVAFRHRLGMVYLKMGRKKEADVLFREDLNIREEQLAGKRSTGAWYVNGSIYYDMAVDNTYFGNYDLAVQCLDSALHHQHGWDWGYKNDPMLEPLRSRDDFQKLTAQINHDKQFRKMAFLNAINRLEASGELKNILR
ncbi:tetratricopeptide repeat protein [Chryseolinea sp. T2]|uniref:tetratricopeptide repeat protein n=1 Tax=Chryseolinea sp. T2 TaxID=3129255 RepID=UPI003077AF9E